MASISNNYNYNQLKLIEIKRFLFKIFFFFWKKGPAFLSARIKLQRSKGRNSMQTCNGEPRKAKCCGRPFLRKEKRKKMVLFNV